MSPFLEDKRDGFCREQIDAAVIVMGVPLFHVEMMELRKALIYSPTQTTKAQNIRWLTKSREDLFPQKLDAFREVRGILVRVFYNFSPSS